MHARHFKHEGPLDALKADVAETGIGGEWQRMPQGYWRYRTADGAILNWWPTTETLSFQGPRPAAERLKQRLSRVWLDSRDLEYHGDLWGLMLDVRDTGIPGKWQMKPYGTFRFRSSDRAVLTYRLSTNAISFTGPRAAKARLQCKLLDIIQRDTDQPGDGN